LVVSPLARLRLTHVENCAEAFVNAAEKLIAGTFNIIDDEQVSAWRYAGRLSSREKGTVRIPMPYCVGLTMAYLASTASRVLLPAGRRKLPGILNPRQYRARFKPLQYDNCRAKEELDWKCQPFFETGCDVT
jgi:nucleoside-diphosphate-sugar epimerase